MPATHPGSDPLATLLAELPRLHPHHAPSDRVYAVLKRLAHDAVAARFSSTRHEPQPFGQFGAIVFPYRQMGAIDSVDLFGLDELMLFSFYWANRRRYRTVLDLGANIGLHSLVLARCGYTVRSFEPDPTHYSWLNATLTNNGIKSCQAINAAISVDEGTMEFVRVLGNTTGSHLAGAKDNVYGPVERLTVAVRAFAPEMAWADLIKMDVEGHEAKILCSTSTADWQATDAVVEIGSPRNAELVFEHFARIGVNLFAQKASWERVERVEDMPTSYRDGSLFISRLPTMEWPDGDSSASGDLSLDMPEAA